VETAHELATENDKRLSVHEAICAERYAGIKKSLDFGQKRMQKIELILYAIIGVLLLGPGFAAELIKKLLGG